jgi:predicted RNase H-like HicB family nuclease
MKFEVEAYRNEAGEWVATAVEHDVTAKGASEREALARLMDALAVHFKQKSSR